MKKLLIVGLVALVVVPDAGATDTDEYCRNTRPLVEKLVAIGDLKPKSADWREVYVSSGWYRYDFEAKQNIAKSIGKCLAPSGAAYFYDIKSGKEVARLTNFGGFKVN